MKQIIINLYKSKLLSNKITYVLYHYEISYFSVYFVSFSLWFKLLLRPYAMQVSEKIMQFWCSNFSQTEHFIQLHSCFVTQQFSLRSVQKSRSLHLLELPYFGLRSFSFILFFVHFAFCVFLWLIGELVRTSQRRLLVTLDDPEPLTIVVERTFSWEIWLVFLPEKPGWVLMGGRMKECWRVIVLGYLICNIGK